MVKLTKAEQLEYQLRTLLSKVSCEVELALSQSYAVKTIANELAIERIGRYCREANENLNNIK